MWSVRLGEEEMLHGSKSIPSSLGLWSTGQGWGLYSGYLLWEPVSTKHLQVSRLLQQHE